MTWEIHPAHRLIDDYADLWQKIQRDHYGMHPLFDVKFIEPALRHLDIGGTRVRLAVRTDGGEPAALALLEDCGWGRWQLFLPSQVPLGLMLVRSDVEAEGWAEMLDQLLAALPGYAWTVSLMKQDSLYSRPRGHYGELPVERLWYATTVNIAVEGSFEDYWRTRSKTLRSKMRRMRARLAREGGKLIEIREASAMAQAVAEHGRLESAGWKGRRGTAIHADNVQGRFYREALERFATADSARVYQLHLDGRVIASQIAIQQNRMMVLLKTTHDESFGAYSPGRLLDYLMLERLFEERRIRVVEFYTKASSEDARWSTGQRDIYHLNYFRSRWLKNAALAARRMRHAVPAWSLVPSLYDYLPVSGVQ